ncbi:MAG: glycoside hydrolase family 16 protein [Sphingomonas sp.]|uniref:glycoside hydrolase family 16 protein n=1 Tax=Sphingomonas sp. TaxID=28214 RepID=UPI00121E63EA|nr:glycoside hydrolase family 16 protein [Sphingomonas sp.]THD37967.1 MAG: glycoside hydrolase family 16 protein [Sphingomonas sp.]
MKRRGLLAAPLLIGAAALPQSFAQSAQANDSAVDLPIAIPKDAKLIWSDEFDRDGAPDPAKWRFDTSLNRTGWYNDEKQYYAANRPENVRIEKGALIIEARNERLTSAADYGGQDYSSGKIDTWGKMAWTYGFVEVRAKLPCGRGTWPSIWMLGVDNRAGWPAQGEIDIMEMLGWAPGVVRGTIHDTAYNFKAGTQRGARITVADACGAFHKYQLDWTKDRILIGVDGHAYMRFANDGKGDPATWPFDKPQYLILNLAIGGNLGGVKGIDDQALPARMTVDYVRVWQRP